MSLVLRNSLFDFDRFFSDAWPAPARAQAPSFFSPRVDIRELENSYEITAELPGISKEDIRVDVRDGVLTLEAQSAEENTEEDNGRVIRQERRYGKFMRSFNLGTQVQEADIKATFKDGVLSLEAPKLVEQEPERRRIEVA